MITEYISGMRRVFGLTKNEYLDIKDKLKLTNPLWAGAVKYSGYGSYTKIPEFLHYANSGENAEGIFVDIPVGVTLDSLGFEDYETVDLREERTVKNFPKFQLDLRATQKEAYKAWIQDTNKGLFSLQTGKGKSLLAIYCAAQLKQRCLIIVHKTDLLLGWQNDIKLAFGGAAGKVGIVQGKKKEVGDFFTIAMIQTISRKDFDMSTLHDKFGMIVADEQHHCPSNSFYLLNHLSAPYKIGLSATPERNDGLGDVMNYYFGDFAYISEATREDEDILPVDVFMKNDDIDPPILFYPHDGEWISASMIYGTLGKKHIQNFDVNNFVDYDEIPFGERPLLHVPYVEWALFDKRTKTGKAFLPKLALDIKKWVDEKRSCVAFVTQKKYVEAIFEACKEIGIPEKTMQTFYGDSEENDETIYKNAESKEKLLTICTYAKASEGTNIKAWEVGFVASTIGNGKGIEQVLGRIRRTKEGKLSPAVVFDYCHPKNWMLDRHAQVRIARYKKMKCRVFGE